MLVPPAYAWCSACTTQIVPPKFCDLHSKLCQSACRHVVWSKVSRASARRAPLACALDARPPLPCRLSSALRPLPHEIFLRAAAAAGDADAALAFLHALPREFALRSTYHRALSAARAARNLPAARAVFDLAAARDAPLDARHATEALALCADTGDADAAFVIYALLFGSGPRTHGHGAATHQAQPAPHGKAALRPPRRQIRPDAHIFTALATACAEAIQALRADPSDAAPALGGARGGVAAAVRIERSARCALLRRSLCLSEFCLLLRSAGSRASTRSWPA